MDDPVRRVPADRSMRPPPSEPAPAGSSDREPPEPAPQPWFTVVCSDDDVEWRAEPPSSGAGDTAPTPDTNDPPTDAA
jgi:hypothetical protein